MVMQELRCAPRPVNHRARSLTLGLLLPAALIFAAAWQMPAYGGVVQFLSLALIVIALFVAYKFIFSAYVYTLTDPGDGVPCLLVEQVQGKRSSLVCRLPLYAVLRVLPAKAEPVRGKAYVYTATMSGGHYQYVVGRMDGVDILLKLEADEDFVAALTAASEEARRARIQEN